ncbi:MAG: NMD3-related protein [Desulfurococcaceae archaeon]|nr:NMD3-related protein [Sulfolobales archaeon]MDW8170465.1 NMD3-related protein [Desulfurococcaceae archaeon]
MSELTRYCIACGRELSEEELPLGGYCLSCFLEIRGVAKSTPVLELEQCSKCSLWKIHGKWTELPSLSEALRKILLNDQRRFIDERVELIEVDEVSVSQAVGKGLSEAVVNATALIGGSTIAKAGFKVKYRVRRTTCPTCSRRMSRSYSAIVQFRSVRGYLLNKERDYISKLLSDPLISQDIVELTEDRSGVDVKFLSVVTAHRVAQLVEKAVGARTVESFKLTKRDYSRGRDIGVTTISVRLPDIDKMDLVDYRGLVSLVRGTRGGFIDLIVLESGEKRSISLKEYWSGRVKKLNEVVEKELTVVGRSLNTLYLLNEETGELIEHPINEHLVGLKNGDRVRGYIIGGRTYVVREEVD